jgi:transposase-like protein
VAHADARTTVYARKLIVARVLAGHRPGEVAEQLGISRQTVYRRVRRWRTEGEAGLAAVVGLTASTIGVVLARAGVPRLAEIDRLTGELLRGRRNSERCYERAHPAICCTSM